MKYWWSGFLGQKYEMNVLQTSWISQNLVRCPHVSSSSWNAGRIPCFFVQGYELKSRYHETCFQTFTRTGHALPHGTWDVNNKNNCIIWNAAACTFEPYVPWIRDNHVQPTEGYMMLKSCAHCTVLEVSFSSSSVPTCTRGKVVSECLVVYDMQHF